MSDAIDRRVGGRGRPRERGTPRVALAPSHAPCYGQSMSQHTLRACLSALRLASWFCVVLIVWLSWIPREWEIRTGLLGQIEHVIAYCGAAALLATAYPHIRRAPLSAGLVGLAGLLEVGQIWVPGRTPQVIDFAASSAGAILGVLLGRAALAAAGWAARRGA
ncbi:hypothetical protein M446_3918 [Methylobacterium sp. 4-46]|nr:hypothetical protein M446_3918 [Methylobacterium sp. 4-46]